MRLQTSPHFQPLIHAIFADAAGTIQVLNLETGETSLVVRHRSRHVRCTDKQRTKTWAKETGTERILIERAIGADAGGNQRQALGRDGRTWLIVRDPCLHRGYGLVHAAPEGIKLFGPHARGVVAHAGPVHEAVEIGMRPRERGELCIGELHLRNDVACHRIYGARTPVQRRVGNLRQQHDNRNEHAG